MVFSLDSFSWFKMDMRLEACNMSFYLSVLGVLVTVVLIHYFYIFTYWSSRGIKGPTPLPLFGNIFDNLLCIVPDRDVAYFKKYGRVYGCYEMTTRVLNIAEPDLLKDILVRDFNFLTDRRIRPGHRIAKHFLSAMTGDEWRRARTTMTPTFTSGKMKGMMPDMHACVDLLEQAVHERTKTTKEVDVKRLFGCYTMDVIAKCAFATDTNAHEEKPGSYPDIMFKMMTFSKLRIIPMLLLPIKVLNAIGYNPGQSGTWDYMEKAVKQIMRQRRESKDEAKRRDMLQLLIEAGDNAPHLVNQADDVEDKELHHDHESGQTLSDPEIAKINKYLTEDEIVANIFLVLIAGYETTATLLTYASYALAMNQDKQDKARAEVKAALGDKDRLDYETVSALPYLDAVVSESLRLYPPALRLERQVTRDYRIHSLNLSFKKGDIIRVPIYAMHHSADFYDEPERFMPERFLPENRHKLTPYTYLPFGAGPRNCIGMRFALLEAKLALAACLLKFKFTPSPRTPARPDFSKALLLLTAKDIFVNIEKI